VGKNTNTISEFLSASPATWVHIKVRAEEGQKTSAKNFNYFQEKWGFGEIIRLKATSNV